MRLLLEHGVDIEATFSKTLYQAVRRFDDDLVRLLFHQDVSVDANPLGGKSASRLALRKDSVSMKSLLLDR